MEKEKLIDEVEVFVDKKNNQNERLIADYKGAFLQSDFEVIEHDFGVMILKGEKEWVFVLIIMA